ncbi:MAG: hypothetical protein KF869_02780 [Phycisphaeraceae bacterium]|nr:hypothetical protein [Phycisphaeraceae bacterium]
MRRTVVLAGPWQHSLEALLASATHAMTLCAPYITKHGTDLVRTARSNRPTPISRALVLTDLSPLAICAGATDPAAITGLRQILPACRAVHLPRLHAKAYTADRTHAIVTSGNLTYGGLVCNHECGLLIEDAAHAAQIDDEIAAYATLGAEVDTATMDAMCNLAVDARAAYQEQTASASREATRRLKAVLKSASDTLVRARLAEGPIHTVFARTIEFLLRRHGPLTTEAMHPLIQQMHPDLCDDTVDRVIDGKRFGKKWKHAARTAQQQLKKRGAIALADGAWVLLACPASNDPTGRRGR